MGNNDLSVAVVLCSLGGLKDDQGNYKSTMHYFEEWLKIHKFNLGDNHKEVEACLSSISFVQMNMRNEGAALNYLKEALEIRKEKLGEDHELISDTHNNLAYFCCSLGK